MFPSTKKTKDGYLKDGFVVDSDKEENDSASEYDENSSENSNIIEEGDGEEDIGEIVGDIGSELSEDSYEY